ncbi:MAG TPA: replication protein C [Methanocorpusculum sp.]|nr:replication protein C [Methanocorpusculum sp.]
MLWIEKYRPKSFADVIGQEKPTAQLASYAEHENLPHLMVIGKPGVGKSASLEIFSQLFFKENASENTTVLPVSVMFSQGHAYLSENERFSHLYQKDKSVIANFKHIVKWHASLQPLSSPFRLIIFDGAGDLPKDAQAALRRIMEKYSKTCRFVFVTSSLASLIDPIRSRCVPLYFLPVESGLMRTHLKKILDAEGCADKISEDNLELLIMSASGDLRKAIVWLEIMALHGETDVSALTHTETGDLAAAVLLHAKRGDFSAAQKIAENLIIEYGLFARDVLLLIRNAVGSEMSADLALLFSNAECGIREGSNEYLQMNAFITELTYRLSGK